MKDLVYYIHHYLVPALTLGLFLIILLISTKRYVFYNYDRKKQAVIKQTDLFLTSLIFISKDEIKVNEKIELLKTQIPFHRTWCKQVVINEMIKFKKTLRGESSQIVIELYKKLELHLYSATLVTKYRYSQKCEGFYQLQHIDYKPARKLVKPYLTHKNKIIRSNAYACYLSLSQGKLERLASIPTEISLLNIIKLMNLLHEKKISIPDNLDEWLYSSNNSVIRMGIKIMVFYNYRAQGEKIISLLNSDDPILRYEAVIACRELFLTDSESVLISLFFHESDASRKEIIRSLKVIGAAKSVAFLKQFITYETESKLKLLAVDTLNYIDFDAMKELASQNEDTQRMLNHVNDPYIV